MSAYQIVSPPPFSIFQNIKIKLNSLIFRGDVKIVRLGDLDLKSDDDNAQPQQFSVSETIFHPEYETESHYHDIGLIKLDSSVKYDSFVRPACLETSSDLQDTKFIATGWGSVEFAGPNSDTLQKVDLDYFPEERCNQVFGPQRQLKSGVNKTIQFCAGGYDDGKDTCQVCFSFNYFWRN